MNVINNIKKSSNGFRYQLITVVLVAVGISFFANGIMEMACFKSPYTLIVGIIVILAAICYYIVYELKRNSFSYRVKAVVPISDRIIYPVEAYSFSTELNRYYKYAAREDKNIDSISKIEDRTQWRKQFEELVIELIEYMLIIIMMDREDRIINKKIFVKYDRNNLKDFVLHNRFFKLFTENTKYRAAFNNKEIESNVVASFAKGALYEKIELYFPKKCKLIKKSNSIIVDSDYFTLTINIEFNERLFGGSKFEGFVKRYVKNQNIYPGTAYIGIEFKPKLKYLFDISDDISYYLWIDDCIGEIIECCSIDEFFKRINWDSLEVLLHCIDKG